MCVRVRNLDRGNLRDNLTSNCWCWVRKVKKKKHGNGKRLQIRWPGPGVLFCTLYELYTLIFIGTTFIMYDDGGVFVLSKSLRY